MTNLELANLLEQASDRIADNACGGTDATNLSNRLDAATRELRRSPTVQDLIKHRRSGKLCTTSNSREILWDGHLCEGANLTPSIDENFCLWTRCGSADVPAGLAYVGDIKDVNCEECRQIWSEENGQFGLGA